MANIIDWYLIEFDRLLKRRIPAVQRESMVAEIEDHLRFGAESETPEHIVERLGSPRQLALVMLSSKLTEEPKWARVVAAVCLFLLPVSLWVAMLNDHSLSLPYIFKMMIGMGVIAGLCILSFRKIRLGATLLAPALGFVAAGIGLGATTYDMGELDGYGLTTKAEIPEAKTRLERNSRWLETTKRRVVDQAAGKYADGPPFSVIINIHRLSNGEVVPETKSATSLVAAAQLVREHSITLNSAIADVELAHGSYTGFLSKLREAESKPGWMHGASIIFWSLWHMPGILFAALGLNLLGLLFRMLWGRRMLPVRRYAS